MNIHRISIYIFIFIIMLMTKGRILSLSNIQSQMSVLENEKNSEIFDFNLNQSLMDTLGYCQETYEQIIVDSWEYILMMFQIPGDGTIKGFNVPIADWGDGETTYVHLSLWKLTYPYDSEGNIYSQLHVDSIGWCGYKWDGLDNSIPLWDNTGTTVYFGDSDDEIGPCENTLPVPNAQELIYQQVWTFDFAQPTVNPEDNPAGEDNWFITKQWGDEPVFSKGEWVGLLAHNTPINDTGIVFFNSCNGGNKVDNSWVLAQFFNKCNGPSGEGGWHILSSVLNWELAIEYESVSTKSEIVQLPDKVRIIQNHPNPFNPITTIKYDIAERSFVEMQIYDLMGREIRTLISESEEAGYKSVVWDGTDSHGNPVSSGMYLYRLNATSYESEKEFHQTRKMVLLR